MAIFSHETSPGTGLLVLVAPFVTVYIAYYAFTLFAHPLRSVPGPFLARFTTFWEWSIVRSRHYEAFNIDLHNKYGHVVRLGPNRYSLSNPKTIDKVYGHGTNFVKDQWYRTFGNPNHAEADLFTIIDEKRHAADRRKVSSLYSMTALVAYEPFVDSCIATFKEKMADFALKKESFDVPSWTQFYAFDVIGAITVGSPFGMMATGHDVEGILQTISRVLSYSSDMGLFYSVHLWLVWVGKTLNLKSPLDNVFAYARRNIAAHKTTETVFHCQRNARGLRHEHHFEFYSSIQNAADWANRHFFGDRPDFMHKLSELRKEGKVNDVDVFNAVTANIVAGSDTTGATLAAAFYHITRTPRVLNVLREEIDMLSAEGKCSDPVTFAEAQQMPYLQAIIKETLRIHPATGLIHARVVPAEGLKADGYFFPRGTVVGVNPWVLHRNNDIFGPDPYDFRPERWLGPKEEVAQMGKFLYAFGAGARTCIGKNISLLEISKVIPTMFRHFDFEFDLSPMPNGKWKTSNAWFVVPSYKCWAVPRK